MRHLLRALVLCFLAVPAVAQNYGLSPIPVQHFDDANGNPCVGCLLFTYQAGATTKLNTFTDATGGTPNADPIVLNARGEAPVWIPGDVGYKFVLAPAGDNDPPSSPIWTVDRITTLTAGLLFPSGGVPGDFITWNASPPTALVDSGFSGKSFRNYTPANFYVAPGGSDSNNCTAVGTPCLTVQHAVNLAMTYDWHGADVTVHLAAGTYSQGVLIGGPLPGSNSGSFVGNKLVILGAGSGSTAISVTNCSPTVHAINVGGGAYVGIGSLKLGTTCGGSDLVIQQGGSTVTLVDGDINFGAAGTALAQLFDHASFLGASNYGFTISGGATAGFLLSTHSNAILSVGATYTITGTPAFTVFVNEIDNSVWDIGLGSAFSGAATGIRYSLNLDSVIDMEDVTAQLPGDQQGNLANGSYIFNNTGNLGACVGGAVGCPVVTTPTGIGDAGTATMVPGSGDTAGAVAMVPGGAGAAAAGIIHIGTPSVVAGPGHQGGFCTAAISSGGANWDARATVQAYYLAGNLTLTWDNNAVPLVNASSYDLTYGCQ